MTKTTVYIVPHTHWDREWYAPFQTFRALLVQLWDELLALAEAEPDFRFLMDGQSVVIDDYLAVRPEAAARLDAAIGRRQIQVGPWYTLPDEFLVSGETLVRNLQRGMEVAAAHGGSLRVGYLPDSFGHAAQMPQLYRQFGFDHAVVWRGVPSAVDRLAFVWEGPDGSRVLTAYMGTSYSHGVDLPTEPAALGARVVTALRSLQPFQPGPDVLLMNGNDHVLPQATLVAAVRDTRADGVRVRLARLDDYLATLPRGGWPEWRGELRASSRANLLMGTLSVRIPDKQRYFEAALALERVAEPLVALTGTASEGLLQEAWRQLLLNAAHDTACGSGIDEVAEEARLRSEAALQISDAVRRQTLPALAGAAEVWNPSAFPRQGLVEVEAERVPIGGQDLGPAMETAPTHQRFPAADVGRVHAFFDECGIVGDVVAQAAVRRDGPSVRVAVQLRRGGVPADLTDTRRTLERLAAEPGVESLELEVRRPPLHRVLVETNPIGGLSVAAIPVGGVRRADGVVSVEGNRLENAFLGCELMSDGTIDVEDKQTGASYRGLHRLVDDADAGDEYNFSPPAGDRPLADLVRALDITTLEAGPLRGSLEARFTCRIPKGLGADRQRRLTEESDLPARLRLSMEAGASRIDIQLDFENRARDHRLRVHFPLPFAPTWSAADTPYHVTRRAIVGATREDGAPELALPTYPMRSFVDVSDGRRGLALIARGLHEYEVVPGQPAQLALALLRCVGWLSRDDLQTRTGHAGPPLPTPAAQLPGWHQRRYSLFFHAGDWEDGEVWRAAEVALLPLVVGSGAGTSRAARAVELAPSAIQMTACIPTPDGFELRLLNASDTDREAVIRLRPPAAAVSTVTLAGDTEKQLSVTDDVVLLPMTRWEIATLRVVR